MKWDGGLEGLSQGLFSVLTGREGNFRTVQWVLFSHSPSQFVPFDPALSRQIKPCATWVVPSGPIDKFRNSELLEHLLDVQLLITDCFTALLAHTHPANSTVRS